MEHYLILASVAIAFSIGANDMANAIGASVGSNVIRYRRAVIYAGIAVAIGAISGGGATIETVGKGIIDTSSVDLMILGSALFCASFVVLVASYLGFPVSVTQSLVGALAGTGIALGIALNESVLTNIAIVWTLLPLISLSLSFSSYFVFKAFFGRLQAQRNRAYERLIRFLVVFSTLFAAFSLGTNNIGNIVGVLEANSVLRQEYAVVLATLGIVLGSLTFSKNVTCSLGKKITPLDPLRAFVSQFSMAISMLLCTFIGIPVSMSQATVGSIMGCGLTRGRAGVNKQYVLKVVGSWVITPLASGALMYVIYWALW
ncbi:MAG: inorganic phosphate transporter [Candidatus Methanofastidiosa archaeon]|nr:inorganic phosphate transporter [Candidatus Methanofastidiosa archaeon]